ncbi:hypothetical protein EV361DRAFT_325141 [Lentinula raphanica]|uniref:Uncharacterized protein n=1 Tax=Lentinula raphanica TaxID=153919 RepID=A0AA38PCX8_9AGAR|nr:hypothetical protein F5880DRAFT_673049 [Lentinula raphanica]KAJ3840603.1 hypothetical protein F5878DRAFT_60698 [Lentinula raphanica]KAJ3969821.1 hypothetical protein EV361DRAFT_325141 [Lentinula raphanica]
MSLRTHGSRPGPLCEWPLDQFLPSSSSSTQVKLGGTGRPNKRPLSPGGPSLFSPTKRRILTQEGIFSPEKTMKSPFRGRSTAETNFGDLLRASGSPAKALDFGRASSPQMSLPTMDSYADNCSVSATPVKSSTASFQLARKANVKSTPYRTFDDDDFFATPDRPPTAMPRSTAATPLILLSRELPPPTDPQSIHYPGFVVYRDPHLPAIRLVSPASSDQVLEDRDDWKENVAPRRKVKKAISDPVDVKPTLLTPEAKRLEMEKLFKVKSTPATPRKTIPKERQEGTSPTPRRASTHSKAGTPVITPEEKRRRRQMLKDEVDEADGMDSEDI